MGKKKRGKKNGLKNIKDSEKNINVQSSNIKNNSMQQPRDSCYSEIQDSLDKNIGINFMNIETIFNEIHLKLNTDLCIPWSKWITN